MKEQQVKNYVLQGTHSDVVWLEDQRDYIISLMKNMEQYILACRFDPSFGIYLHELTYVKPYLDINPEEREFVRKLVKSSRIETGGSHSQPAEVLVSGESILRNILYGRYYHERILGDDPKIYMPWDVFGHVSQLSQMLAKSRFSCCIWSKNIFGSQALFFHQSLDGTKLLFKRTPYSFHVPDENNKGRFRQAETIEDFVKEVRKTSKEFSSLGFSEDLRLNCVDFKPPTSSIIGESENLKSIKDYPIIIGDGVLKNWLKDITEEMKGKKLDVPILARDFEWHHQGTGVSRIDLKIANRLSENTVINAEKFSTIASYLGAKYPDKALDKVWRLLMFNQHHDSVTGTSCDRAMLDMMHQYREALNLSSEALTNALKYNAGKINTGGIKGIPIVVFNPLNWERTDVVTATIRLKASINKFSLVDSKKNKINYQIERLLRKNGEQEIQLIFVAENIPSLGYAVFYVVESNEKQAIAPTRNGNSIENEFYRIIVDEKKGGGIVSLYDKIARRELIRNNEVGNEVIALEEKPDRMEPSWEVYTTGPKYFSRDYYASVKIETGPVANRIFIEGEFKDFKNRFQSITLYNKVKRIDFQTKLEKYRGEHHLHVVTFPMNLQGLQPVFEDRFGAIVKRKSKGKLDFRVHQAKNYSDCGARRSYQWIDYSSSGQIKFSDGQSVSLGMVNVITTHSAQARSTAYYIGEKLIKKGIPSTPSFDDCDWKRRKNLQAEDSIMPKPDNFNEDLKFGTSFRIVLDDSGLELKNIYTTKLIKQLKSDARKKFDDLLKKNGAAYLFCYDNDMPNGWEPLPVLIISAVDGVQLKKAVEKLFNKNWDESATISLPAEINFSSKPLHVDNYGAALINEGNVLNSIESDGTMVLFLMHTAAWGYTPWGKDRLPYFFIPEKKTHNFFYSLYPHEGTWREAKTYRAGFEFNNPLLSVQTDLHRGVLPDSGTFLNVDGDSLVVTALKPFNNPTAGFQSGEVDVNKGIIVRMYEAEGKTTSSKIKFFKKLKKVYSANLIDEPEGEIKSGNNEFKINAGPFSISAFNLIPEQIDGGENTISLGREHELGKIIHFRHWQHNLGAEPIGYSAVAISLKGFVQEKIHIRQGGVTLAQVQLGIVNNYVDRAIKGKVTFEVSNEWRMIPEIVNFSIEPKQELIKPVLISFGKWYGNRKGIIKARLEHDGQIIQDVMEIGGESLLKWKVEKKGSQIFALVENPNNDTIECEISLITPIEGWSKDSIGRYSLFEIVPESVWFQLAPQSKTKHEFNLESENSDFVNSSWTHWIIAKLMYNGKVDYLPIPGTSAENK